MLPSALEGAALHADVAAYAELGEHRTATEADRRTADWLATALSQAGLRVERQRFPVRHHRLREVLLRVEGEVVPAFPLWPPRATGFVPREAPLRPAAPDTPPGCVGLARLPCRAHPGLAGGSPEAEALARAAAGAAALVVVTEGPSGQIVAWDDEGAPDWPIPVVLVGAAWAPRLEAAAARGAPASLVVDAGLEPRAHAENVIGELGTDDGPPLVVTTPTSGWFRCGGERGPGVALWLGLARAAAARPRPGRWLFAATSGHELGGLGMEALLEERAPGPAAVRAWAHLGAALATWRWREGRGGRVQPAGPETRRTLEASAGARAVVAEAFAGVAGLGPPVETPAREETAGGAPAGARRPGTWAELAARGYEGFGLEGVHRFHHTPADDARTTAPGLLEPLAAACWRALRALEARGGGRPAARPL